MLNYIIPLGIILLGVIGLTVYVLTIAVREMSRQLVSSNEKLMILLGARDGGPEVGRALVASMKPPKKEIPGVAQPKPGKEEPKGHTMVVGMR